MANFNDSSLRLLLHCEGGSPPFLTPYLLNQYFPPYDRLVSKYLSLGIELRETCVSPSYEKKVKNRKKGKQQQHEPKCTNSEITYSSECISDEKNATVIPEIKKPTGYKFVGRSIRTHQRIPSGYETISTPCFDLHDQYNKNASKKTKGEKGKKMAQSSSNGVVLKTLNGYQKMDANVFPDVIEKLEATSNIGLFDQCTDLIDNGNLNWKKKNQQSVNRTLSWSKYYTAKFCSNDDTSNTNLRIWIPIVGGDDLNCRLNAIDKNQFSKAYKNIEGIAFIGLHHIKSSTLRKDIITSCLAKVDRPGLRSAMLATKDLTQIMEAALNGIKVIGSDLPTVLANSYKALVLDLRGWRTSDKSSIEDELIRSVGEKYPQSSTNISDRKTKIQRLDENKVDEVSKSNEINNSLIKKGILDLKNPVFATDTSPLMPGCGCFSCSKEHMRSYVHHLCNVNELLSHILLFVHNLYHLLELFEELSYAIKIGRGNQFFEFIKAQLGID